MKRYGGLFNWMTSGIFLCAIIPAFGEKANLHFNQGRGYSGFVNGTSQGVILHNNTDTLMQEYLHLPDHVDDVTLTFREANRHGSVNGRYQYETAEGYKTIKNPFWGTGIVTATDTIFVLMRRENEKPGNDILPKTEIKIADTKREIVKTFHVSSGLNPYDGENIWRLTLREGELQIYGGNKGLKEIAGVTIIHEPIKELGFCAGPGCHLVVTDIDVEYESSALSKDDIRDRESMEQYLANSSDEMEGYWVIFDRDMDESLIKPGGNYKLAVIKRGPDYLILYIDGAEVNKQKWKMGDIKAILHPMPFECIYEVEWFDASKNVLNKDIKAQAGEGETLQITFPYQNSHIRLRKLPSTGGTTTSGASASESTAHASAESAATT